MQIEVRVIDGVYRVVLISALSEPEGTGDTLSEALRDLADQVEVER